MDQSPALHRYRARILREAPLNDEGMRTRLLFALLPYPHVQRRYFRCGHPDRHTGRQRSCLLPYCYKCAKRSARKYLVRTLEPAFSHVPDERLYWITVIVAASDDVEAGARVVLREHRRLRYCLSRLERRDGRFRNVVGHGVREIDVYRDTDLPLLTERKRRLLRALDFPEGSWGGPVHVFHWHALFDVPPDLVGALRSALVRIFPHPAQVMMKAVFAGQPWWARLARLARYGAKAKLMRPLDDRKEALEPEEIATLVVWSSRASRGWQWFRWSVNARRSRQGR